MRGTGGSSTYDFTTRVACVPSPIPLSNLVRIHFRSHQREENRCNCKLESLVSSRHKSVFEEFNQRDKTWSCAKFQRKTNIQFSRVVVLKLVLSLWCFFVPVFQEAPSSLQWSLSFSFVSLLIVHFFTPSKKGCHKKTLDNLKLSTRLSQSQLLWHFPNFFLCSPILLLSLWSSLSLSLFIYIKIGPLRWVMKTITAISFTIRKAHSFQCFVQGLPSKRWLYLDSEILLLLQATTLCPQESVAWVRWRETTKLLAFHPHIDSLSQPKPTQTQTLPHPLLSNTLNSKNSSLARTLLLAPQKPPQPPPLSQAVDQGSNKFQMCPKTKSVLRVRIATMLFATKALRKWILLCLWSKECPHWKNQKNWIVSGKEDRVWVGLHSKVCSFNRFKIQGFVFSLQLFDSYGNWEQNQQIQNCIFFLIRFCYLH